MVLLMQKRALTGGKARTNSGRQPILQRCASAPPLALLQRARMVAYARTQDAAKCRAVRRALSMHVHQPLAQRSPGLPVGPSVRVMDGCNTRLPAHGDMPERSSSTKRAVRTSLSMQSVHEQLVQRETGPGWTAAARVPPLQQPAPASGRAC